MAEYINVTTLNLLAKQVLEQCEPLNNLIVCGEVSNFTRHYKSGHCYFTLKDENAAIKCVMFRDKARMAGQRCMSGTAHSSCIAIICAPLVPVRPRWPLMR